MADSPCIVNQSVWVLEGVTLTIEPGVVVKVKTGLGLQIDGTLIARGTDTAPITFTSNASLPAKGDWGYLLFPNTSTDATFDNDGNYLGGSILEHCVVEYAGKGNYPAVRLESSSPFIHHGTVRNNLQGGINATGIDRELRIEFNEVSGNGGTGIGEDSSTLYITGNPTLNHNNLYGNTSIYELANGSAQRSPNLDARNNWWGTTDSAEIAGRIYDFFDNSPRGAVLYSPYLSTPELDVPALPPLADAGGDHGAYIGEAVGLNGGNSLDPAGSPLTYSWSQTCGPAVTLDHPDTAFASFTAPTVTATTDLCFTLTVSNGTPPYDTARNGVTVTLLPYSAPPADAPVLNPIGSQSVNEGQLLTFTLSGSDVDGDSLTPTRPPTSPPGQASIRSPAPSTGRRHTPRGAAIPTCSSRWAMAPSLPTKRSPHRQQRQPVPHLQCPDGNHSRGSIEDHHPDRQRPRQRPPDLYGRHQPLPRDSERNGPQPHLHPGGQFQRERLLHLQGERRDGR